MKHGNRHLAEWRFLLFTVTVIVYPRIWKVNVIGMATPPFGDVTEPPFSLGNALPLRAGLFYKMRRHLSIRPAVFPHHIRKSPGPFRTGGFPLERKRDRSYFCVMRRAWRAVSKGPGGHSSTGRAAAGTALTGPGAPPLGVGFGVLYHAAVQIAICCAHIAQIFFAVFSAAAKWAQHHPPTTDSAHKITP